MVSNYKDQIIDVKHGDVHVVTLIPAPCYQCKDEGIEEYGEWRGCGSCYASCVHGSWENGNCYRKILGKDCVECDQFE